jgi:hypothetical protein
LYQTPGDEPNGQQEHADVLCEPFHGSNPFLSGLSMDIMRRVCTLRMTVLSSSYQAQYEKQYYRPEERNQDRPQVDPRHSADMQECGSDPASQQSAYHTDDDVTNQPETSPFHHHSGQKTSDQTNHNPGKYSHSLLHFFIWFY